MKTKQPYILRETQGSQEVWKVERSLLEKNRSAVAPFRCLAAVPHEGCTRAAVLPGCPSLDRGSREAEFGFEPRTFRSVNSRSNHLVQPEKVLYKAGEKEVH
ncbi:hypothetical protein T265_01472 [Opisthorchis viverrini]|uniref:Uncharacterized protein n=1 Tax=Opisthorchis viverrini TaxID=6198 RepID=A0A074ZZB2_OPIVI|nr:hypothetical protein T265_01472 [Opisthorchis viverrini]KER32416.1 hypothetical protein T265_01472 [Opisthorchis viverrini]